MFSHKSGYRVLLQAKVGCGDQSFFYYEKLVIKKKKMFYQSNNQ